MTAERPYAWSLDLAGLYSDAVWGASEKPRDDQDRPAERLAAFLVAIRAALVGHACLTKLGCDYLGIAYRPTPEGAIVWPR